MTDILEYKDVKIRYLGHSGFIISKGEHNIVIDPFLTGAPAAVKKPSDIRASDITLLADLPVNLFVTIVR